jgi:tetratricopeptide (TPR) repeat protein
MCAMLRVRASLAPLTTALAFVSLTAYADPQPAPPASGPQPAGSAPAAAAPTAQPVPPSAPGDDRASKAKQLYEEGMAHFQLDEWDPAIESWQAGFRAKPAPQFLYNIAQAYRLSKRPEQALSYYKKYLYMSPKAPNRVEVERHIQSLTALVEQENRTSTRPPVATLPVKPKPDTVTPVAPPPPQPVVTAPPPPPPQPVAQPQPAHADLVAKAPERPITKRTWFWPVVAGGAAVVVAVVVVGAVVGARDNTRVLTAVHF